MLTVTLEKNLPTPLYEQLYETIKHKIQAGELAANEKMPSKRNMAEHLNISQITVQNAYAQLIAEGYLYSRPKSGYFVERIELRVLNSGPQPNYSVLQPNSTRQYEFDMRTNTVDTSDFPFSTWAKIARQVLVKNSSDILNASHPQGIYELRREISGYLRQYRGIEALPEQIVLGAGYEYLMVILVQLLGRTSIHAVEDPGYHKISRMLEDNNHELRPIALDEHGLDVTALYASDANIVHISPSHQFPTGIVMPISRRTELLNWALEAENRYIIESDYDSEFRFSGNPLPACQGLFSNDRVIYLNTFTKSLAPSLRMSYIVLPSKLLEVYWKNFMYYSCTVPNFEQYIISEFFRTGCFERHLNRMGRIYRKKRDIFMNTFRLSPFGDKISFINYDSGLNLLIQISNGLSEQELVERAANKGVRVYGISSYYHGKSAKCPASTVIAGYSGLGLKDLEEAANRLIQAWEL